MDETSFDDYLQQNYHKLQDAKILVDVGNFFLQYPDPEEISASLNVIRIKRLTKIVTNALGDEMRVLTGITYPVEVLESARTYCRVGIERIVSGSSVEEGLVRDSLNLAKLHGHLYSHAAKFEVELANASADADARAELLRSALRNNAECIKVCEGYDPMHIAYQYCVQSKITLALSEIVVGEEAHSLRRQAAEAALESARRTESFDPSHSAFQYTFAADFFYAAAQSSTDGEERQQLLRDAIVHAQNGATMVLPENSRHWAVTCANIGKFAERLYECTANPGDLRIAQDNYIKAADFLEAMSDKSHMGMARALRLRIAEISKARTNGHDSPALSRIPKGTKELKHKKGNNRARERQDMVRELDEWEF